MGMLPRLCISLVCMIIGMSAASAEPVMYRPKPYNERKNDVTIRQVYDFSCGSAALATILTYYHRINTPEAAVVNILRQRYPSKDDWHKKNLEGFSFEDLMFAAWNLGFDSQAANVDLKDLESFDGPVIVRVRKPKIDHFTVLRKAKGGFYYLSDPTLGQVVQSEAEFKKEYTGVALAIWNRDVKLPSTSPLQRIRDGLSVQRIMSGVVFHEVPWEYPTIKP